MATDQRAEEDRPTLRMPATDDFPTGPDVGQVLPDFTLPDQNGVLINYAEARGNHQAMVMFHRSACW
ncbi:MAG: hypothetical protein O2812_06725 [Chloroflexi bacterium]|nr:hypothetical protein [Chloroflexota bacterium]